MTDAEFAAALIQKNDEITAHVNEIARLRGELTDHESELAALAMFLAMYLDLCESHPRIACDLTSKHMLAPLFREGDESSPARRYAEAMVKEV